MEPGRQFVTDLPQTNDRWVQRLNSQNDSERDAALEELRGILTRGLSRALHNHYGNRSFAADDVVQEALLKILNKLDTFQGKSRFTTWAMTIATRMGISELRRRHTKDISLEGIAAEDRLRVDLAVDPSPPGGEALDRRVILMQLRKLIDGKLTEKQRIAIRGLLEGLPVEEIASRTKSNRNAVYKLVHDARLKLKAGFEEAGVVAEDISALFA